jgi:polyisoprenyl-teichoic acid--peptidoglycan teichoic acid transferase
VPGKEKPYRVYRGGRSRGPVKPLRGKTGSPADAPRRPLQGDGDAYAGQREKPPRKRRRWGRWIVAFVLLVVLVLVTWVLLGYFAFRSGVQEANDRLPRAAERALAPQEGALWTNPTNILVLGTDVGFGGREGPGRSDSILLVHTDPDEHRIAQLSIPRDLRVQIPGHGEDKINAAYSLGGPALAIKTVQGVTGLPVNHVVLVDLGSFDDVVNAIGGITVNVKEPILAKFECPKATPAKCQEWKGWRFRKGEQELNGRKALVYARVRVNLLDPADNDVTRGAKQQQVTQAIADKVVGFYGFSRMPFFGDELVKPLATDLSANEIIQLGWVKFRAPASQTLSCHLGGSLGEVGGASVILGSEDNAEVIQMILGESAPQPSPPGQPLEPGCTVGVPE